MLPFVFSTLLIFYMIVCFLGILKRFVYFIFSDCPISNGAALTFTSAKMPQLRCSSQPPSRSPILLKLARELKLDVFFRLVLLLVAHLVHKASILAILDSIRCVNSALRTVPKVILNWYEFVCHVSFRPIAPSLRPTRSPRNEETTKYQHRRYWEREQPAQRST